MRNFYQIIGASFLSLTLLASETPSSVRSHFCRTMIKAFSAFPTETQPETAWNSVGHQYQIHFYHQLDSELRERLWKATLASFTSLDADGNPRLASRAVVGSLFRLWLLAGGQYSGDNIRQAFQFALRNFLEDEGLQSNQDFQIMIQLAIFSDNRELAHRIMDKYLQKVELIDLHPVVWDQLEAMGRDKDLIKIGFAHLNLGMDRLATGKVHDLLQCPEGLRVGVAVLSRVGHSEKTWAERKLIELADEVTAPSFLYRFRHQATEDQVRVRNEYARLALDALRATGELAHRAYGPQQRVTRFYMVVDQQVRQRIQDIADRIEFLPHISTRGDDLESLKLALIAISDSRRLSKVAQTLFERRQTLQDAYRPEWPYVASIDFALSAKELKFAQDVATAAMRELVFILDPEYDLESHPNRNRVTSDHTRDLLVHLALARSTHALLKFYDLSVRILSMLRQKTDGDSSLTLAESIKDWELWQSQAQAYLNGEEIRSPARQVRSPFFPEELYDMVDPYGWEFTQLQRRATETQGFARVEMANRAKDAVRRRKLIKAQELALKSMDIECMIEVGDALLRSARSGSLTSNRHADLAIELFHTAALLRYVYEEEE